MQILFLFLFSFQAFSNVQISTDLPAREDQTILKVSDRLNNIFVDKKFIGEAAKLDPELPQYLRRISKVNLTTRLLSDSNIAFYAYGTISIDTRFMFQAEPFHAGTICHELSHHWGFEHGEDYYESTPYLFGDLCRLFYARKHYQHPRGVTLTKEQAKNYLIRNNML